MFPDFNHVVEDQIEEGDKRLVSNRAEGRTRTPR
jgi:hypothetical protein